MDLLPDSKYSEDVNGIKEEWLAGDAFKRKEFFCWLSKIGKLEMILIAVERDCENGFK